LAGKRHFSIIAVRKRTVRIDAIALARSSPLLAPCFNMPHKMCRMPVSIEPKKMQYHLLACLLSATALFVQVGAFAPIGLAPRPLPQRSAGSTPQTPLFVSSDGSGSGSSSSSRQRRKRKDGRNLRAEDADVTAAPGAPKVVEEEKVADATAAAPAASASPKAVTMQVRDVRDVLSGKPEPSGLVAVADSDDVDDDDDEEEDLADDEEWEYYYEDDDGNEIEPPTIGSGDATLDQLLADAKKLRGDTESDDEKGALEGVSIPGGIKETISTIVTIDFFFVLGLLAWFLTGIFVRSAFGNDAVQIAFNNNFELIVQPALGVLMIAAAAGSFFNEPEEDDRGLS